MTAEQQEGALEGPVASVEAVAKQPRFKSVSLHGADHETMTILASRKAAGATSVVTVVTVREGKRHTAKGATERHGSFEEACARVAALAEEARKLGWRSKASAGGFKAREDDFRALPKPGNHAGPRLHDGTRGEFGPRPAGKKPRKK